ncbi:MAG: hypothetical protein AABO57_23630 [Acidobacteriota bacterium]
MFLEMAFGDGWGTDLKYESFQNAEQYFSKIGTATQLLPDILLCDIDHLLNQELGDIVYQERHYDKKIAGVPVIRKTFDLAGMAGKYVEICFLTGHYLDSPALYTEIQELLKENIITGLERQIQKQHAIPDISSNWADKHQNQYTLDRTLRILCRNVGRSVIRRLRDYEVAPISKACYEAMNGGKSILQFGDSKFKVAGSFWTIRQLFIGWWDTAGTITTPDLAHQILLEIGGPLSSQLTHQLLRSGWRHGTREYSRAFAERLKKATFISPGAAPQSIAVGSHSSSPILKLSLGESVTTCAEDLVPSLLEGGVSIRLKDYDVHHLFARWREIFTQQQFPDDSTNLAWTYDHAKSILRFQNRVSFTLDIPNWDGGTDGPIENQPRAGMMYFSLREIFDIALRVDTRAYPNEPQGRKVDSLLREIASHAFTDESTSNQVLCRHTLEGDWATEPVLEGLEASKQLRLQRDRGFRLFVADNGVGIDPREAQFISRWNRRTGGLLSHIVPRAKNWCSFFNAYSEHNGEIFKIDFFRYEPNYEILDSGWPSTVPEEIKGNHRGTCFEFVFIVHRDEVLYEPSLSR